MDANFGLAVPGTAYVGYSSCSIFFSESILRSCGALYKMSDVKIFKMLLPTLFSFNFN